MKVFACAVLILLAVASTDLLAAPYHGRGRISVSRPSIMFPDAEPHDHEPTTEAAAAAPANHAQPVFAAAGGVDLRVGGGIQFGPSIFSAPFLLGSAAVNAAASVAAAVRGAFAFPYGSAQSHQSQSVPDMDRRGFFI